MKTILANWLIIAHLYAHVSTMALKKRTNKQTEKLNRTVKVLNLLICRAPPTVHFHGKIV